MRAALQKGTLGVYAVNSADLLSDLVRTAGNTLHTVLPSTSTAGAFADARAELAKSHPDQRQVNWQLSKVRHPSLPLSAPALPDLLGFVHELAQDYRRVIDETIDLPWRLKAKRRNAARDNLCALLCGLNHAALAGTNPQESGNLGLVALAGVAPGSRRK